MFSGPFRALHSMTDVLIRREGTEWHRQEGNVKMEADIGGKTNQGLPAPTGS